MGNNPGLENQAALMAAFDHFNQELFSGLLPRPHFSLGRNRHSLGGYFSPNTWTCPETGATADEIGLNANMIAASDFSKTMAVLVHEMIHSAQWKDGTYSKRPGVHNKAYLAQAQALGLVHKSSKGATACEIVDILPDSPFVLALGTLPDSAMIPWLALGQFDPGKGREPQEPGSGEPAACPEPQREPPAQHPATGSRLRYQCPGCGRKCWGGRDLMLLCIPCNMGMLTDGEPGHD